MDAFKSARLFNPGKVTELKPTAATVDSLKAFPLFKDSLVLSALKSELPAYIAAADGVPRELDPSEWWNHNKELLPHWNQGFNKVILCQPSLHLLKEFFRF